MERTIDIAIVGGGFSGSMLAVQLIKQNQEFPLKIYLIEKNLSVGKGVAYSTHKPYHLLNVRADRMSAFPDQPDHFVNWLKQKNIPLSPSGHMPRKVFGEYIQDIIKSTVNINHAHSSIEIIYDEANDVEIKNKKGFIHLQNQNRQLVADKIILTLGNFPPTPLPFISSSETRYCGDPWNCDYMAKIKSSDNVLIIGSGLTMIDTCMNLYKANHKGKIFSISHHGYLPIVHNYSKPYPSFYNELEQLTSVLDLFKVVRKHISIANNIGIDWRSVVDSLRPHTQELWLKLPVKEKEIFLRSLNRIWSIVRHRIPPEYNQVINKLQLSKQLEIISGKILTAIRLKDKIEFRILRKKESTTETLNVDFIINCTGPQNNYSKLNYPLIKNLLRKKMIQPGPFQLGIDAYAEGKIKGENEGVLYTMGPPLTGLLFEITAVPELRKQAEALASKLIFELKQNLEKA
jgi:uncharacterized NAD(P)/FAD-binding protein YdhS